VSLLNFLASDTAVRLAAGLGVLLAFVSEVRYIKKIQQGAVILSLSGILVFLVSSLLGGAASLAAGGLVAGIVPLSFAVLDAVMLYVAYRSGHHGGWSAPDSWFLLVALLGGVGWIALKHPAPALLCSLGISAIGYVSIFRKMLRFPEREDSIAWVLAWLAFALPLAVLLPRAGWRFDGMAHSVVAFHTVACFLILVIHLVQKRKNRAKP